MEDRLYHNILYTCLHHNKYGSEQIVAENALSYVLSGQIQLTTNNGFKIYKAGEMGLIRRNQLVKSLKIPDKNGKPFKSITLYLDQYSLRKYSAENNIQQSEIYTGDTMCSLDKDVFIKAFFDSLLPYFDKPEELTKPLAELKTKEAIELLLRLKDNFKQFLFDFSEPHKIDLEAFMIKSFQFNVSMAEFARLTGRSISTFKRDFKKTFAQTPEKWIREQRLEKAHFLIKEKKQKPSDIYLQVGFENLSHFSKSFKDKFGYNASAIE